MYYVYVLKSAKDSRIYTGFTSNLRRRIFEHNQGLVESTRNRQPLELIYYEAYKNEQDARNREQYLKSGGKSRSEIKNQLKYSLA